MKHVSLFVLVLLLLSSCGPENKNQSAHKTGEANGNLEKPSKDEFAEPEHNTITPLDSSSSMPLSEQQDLPSNQNSEEIGEYDSHYPTPTIDSTANIEEIDNENEVDPEPEPIYDFHAYEDYHALLQKYVSSSGKVNYAGIKNDQQAFNKVIEEFNEQYPTSEWTYNQKLAFWINTYNVFTIKLIIDNYPTTSITKIAEKPWEIKCVKLKGKTYSLDQVENQIIRKQFIEPRIHFALNCASESCPVLLNKAYKAATLSSQLTAQTKIFLKDSSKNTYGKKEITISPIFKWYAADFTKNGSTVIKFINKYRTAQLDKQKLKYSTYSWELND